MPEETSQKSNEAGVKEASQKSNDIVSEEPSQKPDGAASEESSQMLEGALSGDASLESQNAMSDEMSQPSEDVAEDGMVQNGWFDAPRMSEQDGVEPLAETDEEIAIDETNFPDKYFREYLLGAGIDVDENGMLSVEERNYMTSIYIYQKPVKDLTGISYFPNLSSLTVQDSLMVSVNLSGNEELTNVYLDNNEKLESINLSNSGKLASLSVSCCAISELLLNGCTQLESLNCGNNKLTALDLSSVVQLKELYIYNNQLSELNLNEMLNLINLNCSNNQLSALDVSANKELVNLECYNNQLSILDVSTNKKLVNLECSENQLKSLNVTGLSKLERLYCSNNQLRKLDISHNLELKDLGINYNYITSLDTSGNELLRMNDYEWRTKWIDSIVKEMDDGRWLLDLSSQEGFRLDKLTIAEWNDESNVPELTEEGVTWVKNPTESGDVSLTLEYDLSNNSYLDGKVLKCCYNLMRLPEGYDEAYVDLTEDNFPDDVFRNYLKMQYDGDNDGKFQPGMISNLDIYWLENLTDLTGLEFFKALTNLTICENSSLTKLDVSKNEKLTYLRIEGTQIHYLDLRNNPNMQELNIYCAPITALYLAEDGMKSLWFSSQPIAATAVEENGRYVLDLSEYGGLDQNRIAELSDGQIDGNKIYWNSKSEIPLSFSYKFVLRSDYKEGMKYTENDVLMVSFSLTNNAPEMPEGQTIALTAENFPSPQLLSYLKEYFDSDNDGQLYTGDVTYVSLSGSSITSLDGIEKLNCLQSVYVWGTPLRSLNLSSNTVLSNLCVASGSLTDINITGCPYLEEVDLNCNSLTNLDVSQNKMLRTLNVSGNSLIGLDVSQNIKLKYLYAWDNAIAGLDLSNNSNLQVLHCSNNPTMASLNFPSQKTQITELHVMGNNIQSLQINEMPNLTMLEIDSNQGKIKELNLIGSTKLRHLTVNDISLKADWTKMTSLEWLSINNWNLNNSSEKMDLSKAADLQTCYVYIGSLVEVDVHGCTKLHDLSVGGGKLKALNLTGCTALTNLNCVGNQLQTLDVSSCAALKSIDCSGNQLQTLDVRSNKALQNLYCQSNKLSTVDTSNNPALKWFECSDNPIVSLDLSNNKAMLSNLSCFNASLTSLDVGENKALESVNLSNQVFAVSEEDLQPESALTRAASAKGQSGAEQNVRGADTGRYILRLDKYGNFDPSRVKNLSSGTAIANGIMWESKNSIPAVVTYDYDISNNYKLSGSGHTMPVTVQVREEKALSSCTITINSTSAAYTGKAQKPEVVVTDGSYVLKPGIDYTVNYKNNINAGNASVYLAGTGGYTGSVTRRFSIRKASQQIRCTKTIQKAYGSKSFSLKAKRAGNGKLSYSSSNKKVAVVSKSGKVTLKGTGVANITIKAASTKNYKAASMKVTVKVKPAKMTVKSLNSEEGKKLTVKWKKDAKATGYEVQYSTDKKFKKGVKIKRIYKNKTTSCTLTKLATNKKYYVRIRACKTVKINGKKQVLKGEWGSPKQSKAIKK